MRRWVNPSARAAQRPRLSPRGRRLAPPFAVDSLLPWLERHPSRREVPHRRHRAMIALVLTVTEEGVPGSEQHASFIKSPVRLGPGDTNDLPLRHAVVSTFHASVEFDDREVRYVDLKSLNGSELDGERLPPNTPIVALTHPGARARPPRQRPRARRGAGVPRDHLRSARVPVRRRRWGPRPPGPRQPGPHRAEDREGVPPRARAGALEEVRAAARRGRERREGGDGPPLPPGPVLTWSPCAR